MGTQFVEKEWTGLIVNANSSATFNLTGFANRATCFRLEMEETSGNPTGAYDVKIYGRDTFEEADLLYHAEGMLPARNPYQVPSGGGMGGLAMLLRDLDLTNELHVKIWNKDATQNGTYRFKLAYEQFA